MFVRFAILAALASSTLGRVVQLDDRSSFSAVVSPRDAAPSLLFSRATKPPAKGCSVKTCGEACQKVSKRDGHSFAKRAVPRATEPDTCHWSGPENYEKKEDFMAGEGYRAAIHPPGGDNEVVVPLPEDGRTSSKMMRWLDKPVNLAIPHLIGCTSVIVISKKGAWANHIWEQPVFRPESGNEEDTEWYVPGLDLDRPTTKEFPRTEQLDFFKTHAIDRLHSRYDPPTDEHQSGLDDLRNAGEIFDDESDFQVFMYIPYTPVYDEEDPNYGKERPDGLNPAWDGNGRPNPRGDEGTTAFNDQIRDELKSIFGKQDLKIEQVLYAPDLDNFADDGYNSHRGRALVQYQPGDGKDCNSKAKWRVYFEAETDNHSSAEWDPLDSQGDDKPAQRCGGSSKNKRDGCETPTHEPTLRSTRSLTPTSSGVSVTAESTWSSGALSTTSSSPMITSAPALG